MWYDTPMKKFVSTSVIETELLTAIENKDYKKASEVLSLAFLENSQNIDLIKYIEKEFIDSELYNEVIELYKLEFIYTSNPICFEKIGDIYVLTNELEQALDAYLNCAEISEDNHDIYIKLADVFGKLNDNESRIACLKQAGIEV